MSGSFGWTELVLVLFMFGVFVIPYIFFIRTLSRTLVLTRKHHSASPGSVWAILIPIVGILWLCNVIVKVDAGLRGRFNELRIDAPDTGYGYYYVGLALAELILSIIGVSLAISFPIFLLAIPTLICWIVYWIKIARYNKILLGKVEQSEQL